MWTHIGNKKVENMAPIKLASDAEKMFNAFTRMVSTKKGNPGEVKKISDHPETFKENYIVGTTKVVELSENQRS